ncbi:MAG: bifunctional pyr operon transcriptional regulator/uracil phosphoribosyltransferase PyrR [Acidobacteria bacterium]|nr:bifunctional pyr operon transcriptional regulator/uracil phosphoribosyltransferase PyrR [Acidobacteriota bacterium]MXW38151.1 bifunctional pyr operon transcriptional regulator/uracil phosphoribosyltransferase PyrR [Acidobacteriota bacterium]MXZ60377.1 bifunctional pyr operon transcriptional regulator/uracil phosphoribosyltransferase PyrR [Acidobacteriota bacterium]MYA44943.1 bifunctional pyr operon transcriptional regulator/uracil phosphoribosyltransferase PyrR [Acidobacteriota bacterium]MYB
MNTVLGNEEFRAALFRLGDLVASRAPDPLAILGIRRRGVPLAARIRRHLESAGRGDIPVGELDINLYRDDVHDRGIPRIGETRIPFALEEHHILLVDDVLFTGRTVRAALTALSNFGRPRSVRLAVMVDRGGRELPIAADFVGLAVEAGDGDMVRVRVEEEDGEDGVVVRPRGEAAA